MVHHPHLVKDANALFTKLASIDAVQMENGTVYGQAGPDGRHRIFFGPIDNLSERAPVRLLRQIGRLWLGASYDESVEITDPQIVNVGI